MLNILTAKLKFIVEEIFKLSIYNLSLSDNNDQTNKLYKH